MIWTTNAPITNPRVEAASGVIGTKFYVSHGRNFGRADTLYEYDEPGNAWATKAISSPAIKHTAGGAIGAKLYVAGGDAFTGTETSLREWDQATDTWTTKAVLPAARQGGMTGVIGTKLYYAGGHPSTNAGVLPVDTLYEWDQPTNVWAIKTAMPAVRVWGGGAVIGTKFYVIGGYDGDQGAGPPGTVYSTLWEYDQATNAWTVKAAMPGALYFCGAVAIGTAIYVCGGSVSASPFAPVDTVYRWDQATDTWTTDTSLPAVRYAASVVAIGTQLYVAGGADAAATKDTVYTTVGASAAIARWSVGSLRIK